MKILIGFILLFIVEQSIGQSFSDVAFAQGITYAHTTPDHFACGMTFYDFDEDGWDDLTIPKNNDSLLFYKNVNGDFQQIGSLLYVQGSPRSILWVDYDNDMDLDLCLTYATLGMRIYQNDGAFNFTDVTQLIGISGIPTDSYGASFVDPDSDGDLDIYLCNYIDSTPLPQVYNNQYYVNQGDGTFIEMGLSAGINNGVQTSFMGVWYDYDEDNDIDLHVINDRNPYSDALYSNNNDGTFSDVAPVVGVENQGHDPMGISISDYNNDGFQDVFISDGAGGGISNGFPLDHKLYTNQNGNNFIDQAQNMGIDTNIMAWGGLWVDYDNDGFEDLYIATSDLSPSPLLEKSSLFFKNESGANFELINDSINGNIISSAYAPVKGDINNDGFYDIVVLNGGSPINILENSGNENNYIKITPIGTISNQKAIGAKVRVYAGGLQQYQTVTCGSGICSQNSQHMIFGVGNANIVDSLIITFPSGIIVRKYNLPVESDYQIIEKPEIYVEVLPGSIEETLCEGDSLIIGNPLYTNFIWNTGSTDSILTVMNNGIYSFTAENYAGDTVYHSNELNVIVEQAPIYQNIINHPECGLENLGSISLLFISPTSNFFDITWSNGDFGITADSLSGGTYNCIIESQNNCVYHDTMEIVVSPDFNVQFLTTPETNSNLGSVEFFIFGGTPPFSFELNSVIENSFITGLSAGDYSIIVTDANGCEMIITFTINNNTTANLEPTNSNEDYISTMNGYIYFKAKESIKLESIEVISILGNTVMSGNDGVLIKGTEWRSSKNISSGIYLFSYRAGDEIKVKRIFTP